MPKCDICGSETDLNYGKSTGIVCKNCARDNPAAKNVIAKWLKIIGILIFIISTVSAVFMFFASQGSNFDMAIITFVFGIAAMLLFFGLAEIIRLLEKIYARGK